MAQTFKDNIKFQKWIAIFGIALFVGKLLAWKLTLSVAVLSDAFESIINIFAAFLGWYSLYLSALPKDTNHPYGHGKVEFVASAIESILIAIAGVYIAFEALHSLIHEHQPHKLDIGLLILSLTAIINYALGALAIHKGESSNSLVLVSSGKHLQADTLTTAGILVGLLLLYITKIWWIDGLVAFIVSLWLLVTGYRILRTAIAGIMDEADFALIAKLAQILQNNRAHNWIDLHNLRIIKYGNILHIDCHLTVPWYFNVHEAHLEIDNLANLIRDNFGESVEFFVHTDGCLNFSCPICIKTNCLHRKHKFEKTIDWTLENLMRNSKHHIEMATNLPAHKQQNPDEI